MINADSLEVEVSSIGTIEGEVSSANSIEGELNNTTITADIKLQEKSVTPSTSQQNVVFDSGYNGLSKVVVNAVDSSIDSDIKASNIKTGVNILGVTGTLKEYVSPKLQSKSATPKTTAQTINADSSYDGLSSVSISAVDNSIDSNIKAGNIKSGVSILGITGTLSAYTEPSLQNKTITPSTSKQTISADASYDGLGTVTVNAVTSSIDSDIKATNIRKGIDILGITGTMEEYVAPKLQEKTVSPSTSSQSVTPDSSYDGLSKVTVNAMATTTQATPSISVSSSGLITASSTQTAGYVSAGTKSSTKQLTTKGATTYTPNTSNQTISSGTYLTGTQTIKGDSNLVASNIKKNVSIFGVTGTLEEGTTEDLTSEFNQYETYLGTQETTIDNIITALQGKTSGGGGSGVNPNEFLASFLNDTLEVIDNEFVTSTHSYCICNKSKLKMLRLSGLTTLAGYAVSSCTALHTAEFDILTKMVGVSFNGCTALEKLILRSSTMCSLANASALARTKIESGTGYIYVPDNLVDSYKGATNWSTYANQIKGLSEL